MKRKATIGLSILFFFPFIWQSIAAPFNDAVDYNILLAPPSNDDCADATTLTVNQNYLCTNVTAGTVAEATASTASNACAGSGENANNDVWFKFVATAASHKIELFNISGTETDLYHVVYDGGVGGNCSTTDLPIFCSEPETSELTSLTAGNTYFIRVFTNAPSAADTTFDICVGSEATAPSNDDCANAEGISSLPFSEMYDASGATNNTGFITASGCIDLNDGVWYTINGDGGDITITVSPSSWDAAIGIYEGSCGALTCVTDRNIGGSGVVEAVTFTSTLNTTYFVNIAYPSGTVNQPEGIFDLSVTSSTLSIDEIVAKGFYYYPNPVENVLKMSAGESIDQVSLYTILGREIKRVSQSELEAELDLSNLSSGTYFVRVVVGDASGSFKIIKN